MKHALSLLCRVVLMVVAMFAISVGIRQILDFDEKRPSALQVSSHLAIGLVAWTASCALAPRSPHRREEE